MVLIFVVDNDKDTCQSIKLLLKNNGYRVIVTHNGDDCLKEIDKEIPDLILLDLFMPGKPVNELIDKYSYIKFIIISAYLSENLEKSNLEEDLIKSLKSPNVVGKISKPFNNRILLELVKKNVK